MSCSPQQVFEAMRVICSTTASGNKREMVMVNDVSVALFHAPAKRRVYVQLPDEGKQVGEAHLCGRLSCSMYGTRVFAQNGFDECSRQCVQVGFE